MHEAHDPFVPLKPIPRFFVGKNAPRETVAEVVASPLKLVGQPFDYYEYSPTPLDPHLLQGVNGPLYDVAALRYMDSMRLERTIKLADRTDARSWYEAHAERLPDPTWVSALNEMRLQHALKLQRNDNAIRRLHGDTRPVDVVQAERIMRVRAGIASIPDALHFLADYPEVGGVELMKATRPFDPVSIGIATASLFRFLRTLDEPDIEAEVTADVPHHQIPVEDPRIIVLKTPIARVAVAGVSLDVILRDSGVVLDPKYDNLTHGYMTARAHGGAMRQIAPIAVTAYARLTPGQ